MHIFHALFTPVLGGLEQSFINTTEILASKGHRVTALLRRDAPYYGDVAKYAHSMPFVTPIGFYDMLSAWRVRRLLQKQRPDMIIAHNGRAITLMKMAASGMNIPVIGVSHSYKTKHAMRADGLIVLSEHMRRHFMDAGYRHPTHIIPNLIRLGERAPRRPRGDTVIIGALGRFVVEKGFDDLLRALHLVRSKGLAFVLHLAGDGPEKARLQTLAEQLGVAAQIRWLGWQSNTAAFYREIDLFCLPSRQDSFPMVMLETLGYGVPMISTDTPGPLAVFTHDKDALITPCEDITALADAISRLITQPETAARLSDNGWQTIQNYSFPAIAATWDETLRAIASASARQAA